MQAVSDSQLYFILGRPGKVLILDGAGQYVTTMSATGHSNEDFESDEVFTSLELGEGKLLLGTSTGSIHIHDARTLKKLSVIPNQFSLSEQLANVDQERQALSQTPVSAIKFTETGRFLLIQYRDGSQVLVDREDSKPIIHRSKGHTGKVESLIHRTILKQQAQER